MLDRPLLNTLMLDPDPTRSERYRANGLWTNQTILDHLTRRLAQHPQRTAMIDRGRLISFEMLDRQSRALAASLAAWGLMSGDVISFQLPNWLEAAVINLAAARLGLVCNPIVPIYRLAEVSYSIADSGSRLLFIPDEFRNFSYRTMTEELKSQFPYLRIVIVGASSGFECLLEDAATSGADTTTLAAAAPKLLMYTSGTTGPAKGVIHSSNTLMAELNAVATYWSIGPDDVILMPSPVTHVTGYLYGLELPIVTGCSVVFMEQWSSDAAVDLCMRHSVSLGFGATPFLKELLTSAERAGTRLSALRLFACGGAPVPPELVRRANNYFENCIVSRIYGSTEAPTITLGINDPDDTELGATTDGRIVGHEVRIVDPATDLDVTPGETGEILTRSAELFLGYKQAGANRTSFTEGGFFRTGDLGRLVGGEFIEITGRKKDLIIRGGENISPKEIEDALIEHPLVQDAAVVAMPSERLGEAVCAYIIPTGDKRIDVSEALHFLVSQGLAKQKCPERIEMIAEFPRTAAGKVKKDILRDLIAATLADEGGRTDRGTLS